MLKRVLSRVGAAVGAGAALVSLSAHAQAAGIDYSGMTSQIDWSTTTLAVMAVAGTLVVLYMAIKGAKIVLAMVKGR